MMNIKGAMHHIILAWVAPPRLFGSAKIRAPDAESPPLTWFQNESNILKPLTPGWVWGWRTISILKSVLCLCAWSGHRFKAHTRSFTGSKKKVGTIFLCTMQIFACDLLYSSAAGVWRMSRLNSTMQLKWAVCYIFAKSTVSWRRILYNSLKRLIKVTMKKKS